jgi:hypothetical protein
MISRLFEYEKNGELVLCPCCGTTESLCDYACQTCWLNHGRSIKSTPNYWRADMWRAAFHILGADLRKMGMLLPLKTLIPLTPIQECCKKPEAECLCWGVWLLSDGGRWLQKSVGDPYRGSQMDARDAALGRVCRICRFASAEIAVVVVELKDETSKLEKRRGFSRCALPWCDQPGLAGDTYCSERCDVYDGSRNRIEKTRHDFCSALAARQGAKKALEGLSSELAWADAMRDEELGKLERQWRALRVPPVEGH